MCLLERMEVCIMEIQIHKLHEEYYKNIISQDDGICSSYTRLDLQISVQLVMLVYGNCVA